MTDIEIDWDKDKAKDLFIAYKNFWSGNPVQHGITGKPDAGTGKPNSKSVWLTLMRHGNIGHTRDEGGTDFYGAGDMLESLEALIDQDNVLDDDIDEIRYILEQLNSLEKNDDYNPQNIPYHTIIEFEDGKATRGEMYGHFLTPAYHAFRTHKSKQPTSKGEKRPAYNIPKPQAGWSSASKNTAKPPFWQAMYDDKNSLRVLLERILDLLDDAEPDPTKPPTLHIRVNKGKIGELSSIPGIQEMIREVITNPSIYPRGKSRAPVKDRLNQLAGNTLIQLGSKSEIEKIAAVTNVFMIDNGERRSISLEEIPNFEKLKDIKLGFPKNNKVLNYLIQEIMGDEMKTFRRPNMPEDGPDGLVLKSVTELIIQASDILKVMR